MSNQRTDFDNDLFLMKTAIVITSTFFIQRRGGGGS